MMLSQVDIWKAIRYTYHMKICFKCKETKPLSEFARNASRPDGLQSQCRLCQVEYRKNHYEANKQKIITQIRNRQRELQSKIWEIKVNSRCCDCEYDNPKALQFDHIEDKEFNISGAAFAGYSWERIQEEIDKCEIVCANCHSIRTFDRGGWQR